MKPLSLYSIIYSTFLTVENDMLPVLIILVIVLVAD